MTKDQLEKAKINREYYDDLVLFRKQVEKMCENPLHQYNNIDFSLIPPVIAKEKVKKGHVFIQKGEVLSTNKQEVEKLLQPILDYCFSRELEINEQFKEI